MACFMWCLAAAVSRAKLAASRAAAVVQMGTSDCHCEGGEKGHNPKTQQISYDEGGDEENDLERETIEYVSVDEDIF